MPNIFDIEAMRVISVGGKIDEYQAKTLGYSFDACFTI